jgi:hypothetical protein
MPLPASERLGPGNPCADWRGGEVYRLPEAFARDLERMARFRREADVPASLYYRNMDPICGVEERGPAIQRVMTSTALTGAKTKA